MELTFADKKLENKKTAKSNIKLLTPLREVKLFEFASFDFSFEKSNLKPLSKTESLLVKMFEKPEKVIFFILLNV